MKTATRVAVVGDGAFSSGIVLEALNHAGGLKKNLIVVLNDNKMSICPRVGGLAESLDRVRMNSLYAGIKSEVQKVLARVPVIGDPVERFLHQVKDAVKAGLVGGMLFQELGFNYHGPVDGHSIRQLQKYLAMAKQVKGPVLLHVVTEKGHGYDPAAEDPVLFHTPAPFSRDTGAIFLKANGARPFTAAVRDTLLAEMAPRRLAGGRHHGRHVPGQHARADPRRVSRPFLRRRHLRIARGGLGRRHGQGRTPARGRHLQHVPATELRPDLPGGLAAGPAGDDAAGPRRPGRTRRPDAPRRVRHRLSPRLPQPGHHVAGRRSAIWS